MSVLWPALASGLVNELSVQGTLLDEAGNGLDGTYELTFSLYADAEGGTALWTETQTDVVTTGGFFDVALGSDVLNPLTAALFGNAPTMFVGIKVEAGPGVPVGGDPELDRRALTKVAAAFVAEKAVDADNFGGNSPETWMTNILQAVADDGYIKGGVALDQSNMPANGLNEVSNDLLTNQFTDEVASSTVPKAVGTGITDQIVFPDIGSAEKLTVNLEISSTEPILKLSKVKVILTAPNADQYTLFDGEDAPAFSGNFPDPTPTLEGDLTTWIGLNPQGIWTLQVIDLSQTPQTTLDSWSISLSTLSNKKVQVQGNLIVDGTITGTGGTTIEGDLEITGSATFGDGAIINGNVEFSDLVTFNNSWCPTRPNGMKSIVANGVCVPAVKGSQTMQNASLFCASLNADLCTDSQSRQIRASGLLMVDRDGGTNANWTNSYAGDDSGRFRDSTGPTGDDHGSGNPYLAPCCYNSTPARASDTVVGTSVRMVFKHDVEDSTWDFATRYCTTMHADLCSKAQYQVLRDQGEITKRMWSNDHSDNDGQVCASAIGNVTDDPSPDENYGFACCATSNKPVGTTACPAGVNEDDGVCWIKVGSGTWNTAVADCDNNGGQLCSISQNYVLRQAGRIGGSGNWTQSHSDNYAGHVNFSLGGGSDNPTNGQGYNYACCL